VIVGDAPRAPDDREETRFSVLRRLPSGRPDRSFGGGSIIHLHANETSSAISIGLQSGDRIVALVATGACERSCSPIKYTLVRYRGGSGGARCMGRRATVIGTRSGETLIGTRHRDVIAALSGNDVVRGRGGNDLVCGGRGDDRLFGGGGRDRLIGGPGLDEIQQ
jgi:Ca2+-binding RTX toxin-like protein